MNAIQPGFAAPIFAPVPTVDINRLLTFDAVLRTPDDLALPAAQYFNQLIF